MVLVFIIVEKASTSLSPFNEQMDRSRVSKQVNNRYAQLKKQYCYRHRELEEFRKVNPISTYLISSVHCFSAAEIANKANLKFPET